MKHNDLMKLVDQHGWDGTRDLLYAIANAKGAIAEAAAARRTDHTQRVEAYWNWRLWGAWLRPDVADLFRPTGLAEGL